MELTLLQYLIRRGVRIWIEFKEAKAAVPASFCETVCKKMVFN